jgi:hypothetical protein
MEARRLRNYFECHRIRVITNQPLNNLFTNKEALGRITKWAAKLSEFTVDFERRNTIKSQVLANFVVDWKPPTVGPDENVQTPWMVHCDRAWGERGSGISAIVTSSS